MSLSAINPPGKHSNSVHTCSACLLNITNISESDALLRIAHTVASHYDFPDTFHSKTVLGYFEL